MDALRDDQDLALLAVARGRGRRLLPAVIDRLGRPGRLVLRSAEPTRRPPMNTTHRLDQGRHAGAEPFAAYSERGGPTDPTLCLTTPPTSRPPATRPGSCCACSAAGTGC